jgi:protein-tyrosine phosphatase
LIPGIDDGSKSAAESLAMARMAAADGIRTIIATPHQLGNYASNSGAIVRQRVVELQAFLRRHQVDLQVLPGADVRIEDTMFAGLRQGTVLTLGDHHKHVLIELPHEVYLSTLPIVEQLRNLGLTAILSHPERNQGILRQPHVVTELVRHGCLMQVTAASLLGTFGAPCQQFAEWMLSKDLVHFVATDAHGAKSRRPLLTRCYERVRELSDANTAASICCHNPQAVADGQDVALSPRPRPAQVAKRWFGLRKRA